MYFNICTGVVITLTQVVGKVRDVFRYMYRCTDHFNLER